MDDFAENMPPEDREVSALSLPPHSMEAEQSVLGGLLLENSAWDRIADVVMGEDFYRHEHRVIFRTISRLINESRPADVITVQEALERNDELEAAGGFNYLITLAQNTPSAANIRRKNPAIDVTVLGKPITAPKGTPYCFIFCSNSSLD